MYKAYQRVDGVAIEITVADGVITEEGVVRFEATDRFGSVLMIMDKTEARALSNSLAEAAAEAGFKV
jgi:hypothetical protein